MGKTKAGGNWEANKIGLVTPLNFSRDQRFGITSSIKLCQCLEMHSRARLVTALAADQSEPTFEVVDVAIGTSKWTNRNIERRRRWSDS
jgi:hypothetical protein